MTTCTHTEHTTSFTATRLGRATGDFGPWEICTTEDGPDPDAPWCPDHGFGCEPSPCPCGHTLRCDCVSISGES